MAEIQKLRRLAESLGSPGVQALWLAARKQKIQVTTKQVVELVATRGKKQIFRPVVPATGKSVSEDYNARYQMDLADLRNQPSVRGDKTYKCFLVLVNVFSREIWAKELKTKEPREVLAKLP